MVQNGMETGVDCGGPACDAQGMLCGTGAGCAVNADCTTGYCEPGGSCAFGPNGNACTAGTQCASGNCVGPAGAQLCCVQTSCTDQGAASCSTNGACTPDGSLCQLYPSGTLCGAALSCSGDTLTPATTCDGNGNCQSPTAAACANYLYCADGTSCATSCASGSDCVTGICNTTTGACLECQMDSDCSGTLKGEVSTPRCSTTANVCVQCLTNADCPAAEPSCNAANLCVQPCTNDGDCTNTVGLTKCGSQSFCVQPCSTSTDCASTAFTPLCGSAGICVQCLAASDCAPSGITCSATNICM
jgi:hypothetical protein